MKTTVKLFILSLLISGVAPQVQAATPSARVSAVLQSASEKLDVSERGTNSLPLGALPTVGSAPLLSASVGGSAKEQIAPVARKIKVYKDTKSGVTLALPAVSKYVVTKENLFPEEAAYGYLNYISARGEKEATALSLVSYGMFGLVGWDSLLLGARTKFDTVIEEYFGALPAEVVDTMAIKRQSLTINGYDVEHYYIEYRGVPVFGTYAGLRSFGEVVVGVMTVYLDPAIVSKEKQNPFLTPTQAKEFLVTSLSKSTVNGKQANKYFKTQ